MCLVWLVGFLCYFIIISFKTRESEITLTEHLLNRLPIPWMLKLCPAMLFLLTTVTILLFLQSCQLISFCHFLFLKNAFKPLSLRTTWISPYHPSELCWNVTFLVRCSPTTFVFIGKKLPHSCHNLWGLNFPSSVPWGK